MINPETNEIVIAARALALADTLGHSVTPEEAHAQAQEIFFELRACPWSRLKGSAETVVLQITEYANASSERAVFLARLLEGFTEDLRGALGRARDRARAA